jgi:hypothetical protein
MHSIRYSAVQGRVLQKQRSLPGAQYIATNSILLRSKYSARISILIQVSLINTIRMSADKIDRKVIINKNSIISGSQAAPAVAGPPTRYSWLTRFTALAYNRIA